MRRKSERAANKKVTKSSPEKKVEKLKRTRNKRKQSTSSDNESADESSPIREVKAVAEVEKKPPTTPVKEDSPEEAQDQVWQVKATEGSGDVGEIQKLKICLTRPPSTPERTDRSPRSKRKHSRATSSSDTPSVEAVEERKKTKHRSKRSTRESKDESDKNQDSQGDEPCVESELKISTDEVAQSSQTQQVSDETPMSTTTEEVKTDDGEKPKETEQSKESQQGSGNTESNVQNTETETQNKSSDADTTVASPKADTAENQDCETEKNSSLKRCLSEEMLEIHADDSKISDTSEPSKIDDVAKEEKPEECKEEESASTVVVVSILEENNDKNVSEEVESAQNSSTKDINETDVIGNVEKRRHRNRSTDLDKSHVELPNEGYKSRQVERSDSTQSTQEENVHNGQTPPIVISRKRKWGSRPKISSQKSITISTDVLKEIIPDVKPVEFDEVIEEKKQHKKIEMSERLERPVLPKIVIDNSDNVEQHRMEQDNRDKENFKVREPLGFNRKISIVNDSDNIIGRPPSPARFKQSNILFITNLVRPFTLPQLKNLLQRTGRIKENGFWIDRIKSKCFVKYETEDQAVETRHALHGVTWPVSNPKALQVDFSTQEAFDNAKLNEDTDNAQASTIPGTVEDWLREQDQKRERGELEKPWERKTVMREWDVGKNEKDKEKDKLRRDDRKRHRTPSPEPAKKFKKKEEEAPAKLLDDLFRKTKTTPCIYWLPLSAETIAIKEEQRRQHMAEHERRLQMQEFRRPHRRH